MAAVRGIEGSMSEVISLRLNPENPQEAEALSIIKAWRSDGFNVRHRLTKAIINNDHSQFNTGKSVYLEELNDILSEVNYNRLILRKLSNPDQSEKKQGLSNIFVSSVKNTAKPGITMK